MFYFLDQRTVTSDGSSNNDVLTKAELTVGVDLGIAEASATGSLNLDDYNKDKTDDDYFKLREKTLTKL